VTLEPAHGADCPFESESLPDELTVCKRDSDCRVVSSSCKNDPMSVNVKSVSLAKKSLAACNPKGCGSIPGGKFTAVCTEEGCETEEFSAEMVSHCSKDSDCVLVPFQHCCGSTKKAINKRHRALYEKHPEWQKFNDPAKCAVMGMCVSDKDVTKAECVGHPVMHCEPKF
jgi:hypothetical protein